MDDEFRVGAAAEFVQVHADALAVGVDAEGDDAVEQPEEQVDERQEKAEQRGDADELGDELACLRGEEARGEESPEAADGVNGDGAGGIVDGDGELKHFDQQRSGNAGDEADEDATGRA